MASGTALADTTCGHGNGGIPGLLHGLLRGVPVGIALTITSVLCLDSCSAPGLPLMTY